MTIQTPALSQTFFASATLAKEEEYLRQGNLAQLWELYQEMLIADPSNPELLRKMSLVCVQRKDLDLAIALMNRALPDHPIEDILLPDLEMTWIKLGRLLMDKRDWVGAATKLEEAMRLRPDHAQVRRLLTLVEQILREVPFIHYQETLDAWHTSKQVCDFVAEPQITIFLDQEMALRAAHRGDRLGFPRHSDFRNVTRVRVCYYVGEPIPDAPAHLVRVPVERDDFIAFFVSSRLPTPDVVGFDPSIAGERDLAYDIAVNLRLVRLAKEGEKRRLIALCPDIRPEFVPGQSLRVFFSASRTAAARQFSLDFAQGFRDNGCEVFFSMESNEMESLEANKDLGSHLRLQEQINFNPHIVVTFNRLAGGLHPDVFNVAWWIDPTSNILSGVPLPWRKRDLIYAGNTLFDHLQRCGAPNLQRQLLTYNHHVFRDMGKQRKRKAVFVGIARRRNPNLPVLFDAEELKKLLALMAEMFAAGELMTDLKLEELAKNSPYTKEQLLWSLWRSVIRDHSVRWLCELSQAVGIEVEVYGRFWEQYDWAHPFFKGELDHGAALATVLNDTLYGLVTQPATVLCQRTIQLAACGVIPIVYDVRHLIAKQPYLDEHFLWYRTKEDMRACLTGVPPLPPHRISHDRTGEDFVKRILARIESHVSGAARPP